MSRFNNLNWDEVFNKKKNMTGVKISLNNQIEFFYGETKVCMFFITSVIKGQGIQ